MALVSTLLAISVLSGCSTAQIDRIPKEIGGLPESAPKRADVPPDYPAVHDMPPPRTTTLLDEEQQKRMEADLIAARNRQPGQEKNRIKDAQKKAKQEAKAKLPKGLRKEKRRAQPAAMQSGACRRQGRSSGGKPGCPGGRRCPAMAFAAPLAGDAGRRMKRTSVSGHSLASALPRDKSWLFAGRPVPTAPLTPAQGFSGPEESFGAKDTFPWKNFTAFVVCHPMCSSRSIAPRRPPATRGADIIDLGMGNPDLPAPPHVIEKLKETLGKPRTDRYSASKGIAGLRRAQAAYYARRFGVKLNPDTQIVATLGSKEGFANVAQAITAPGDVVLVPNPSYPIHAFGFLMAGGVIRSVPAEPNPEFFAALERALVHSIPKPIAVIACYPANPTACVASLDFYRDLVAFAKKHEIFILSDLAYAEVYFDDNPPPSVLQVPGAMDVTVEFTSMSKTFSMPGWRMGFAVGNERIIAALGRVKSYLDYGAFTPVQVAATAALNGPDDCIREMRDIYRKRRDALVESFGRAGWHIPSPAGVDVRLGEIAGAVPGHGLDRILQAAGREGRCRGRARHRLRRAWRRPCPHRAGGERAAHPAGRAQYPPLP